MFVSPYDQKLYKMGSVENSTCTTVSRQQYLSVRAKPFSFHESYLYQTEIEHTRQEKLRIFTYELPLRQLQTQAYFQRLNMMSKYLSKGNLQLPLLCISQNKDECGCSGEQTTIVKFYYQNYDISLASQIKARSRCFQQFNQQEVWFILYSMINALRQYEPFSEPSGNITVNDILLNKRGDLKLRCDLSGPHQAHRTTIFQNYFAPEELKLMRMVYQREGPLTRNIYKEYNVNPNISQVYSLGIVLLTLTTKCNPVNLYAPPFETNQNNITAQLSQLQSLGYSRLLTNLIKIMLCDYRNRPLPSQIRHIFKEYESQILSFRPFNLSLAESRVSSVL